MRGTCIRDAAAYYDLFFDFYYGWAPGKYNFIHWLD